MRLDTPTAFELVARREGATLVWAPADASRGALFERELDASGAPQAEPACLRETREVPGDVADLAAAWVKERLALAWIERDGAKARVRATWAAGTSGIFELGPAWSAPRTARGNLVVRARGEEALVFARGDEAPCIEAGRRGCFGFGFHALAADRARATGLPLSVPVPCTDFSTVLSVVGSRWHYGVCTDAGKRPVTTLFTIQESPEYARADPLLEGCEPSGLLGWDGRTWLIADCAGQRRAARVGIENEPAVYLDLRNLRVECDAEITRVRSAGFDLTLDEPRDGVQMLLPAELAPRGARAVWTGRALVVATALGDELRLFRHVCRAGKLVTAAIAAQ